MAGEYAALRFEGWPTDWNASYASLGHYFGDWLPYALWPKANTRRSDEAGADLPPAAAFMGSQLHKLTDQEQTTVALGLRYQVRPGLSLKAQIDQISQFNGTRGLFNFPLSQIKEPDTAYLYSLNLNAAF